MYAIFLQIPFFFLHRWNYWFAGGLHPCGFHVVNIILHGLVSVVLLWIASVCFCGQLSEFGAPRASLLCALLFATHPIHTESVSTKLIYFYVFCNVFMIDVKTKYIYIIQICHGIDRFLVWLAVQTYCVP